MPVNVLASLRAKHQLEHQDAIIEGLAKHGIEAVKTHNLDNTFGPVAICWGWRIGKILRELGYEVLVLERGYLGDRFSYTSLGWNGLNGHAEFPEIPYDGGERFSRLGVEIKPWDIKQGYALILGQVPKDASLKGMDMVPWYEEKAHEIKKRWNCDVLFRPHPDLKKKGISQQIKNTELSTGTLQEALSGAAFSVCFNSNSAVDSVINGIRCVVGDKGTMAYGMCSQSVSSLVTRDRTLWAHRLAQKQWTLDEIRSGEALKGHLCKFGA